MIGLLVFLGLLGTFWGLLQTIGAVGNVVGSIDTNSNNFEAMMRQLRVGLDAPLSGMATAFSSSLFGLAGSLILGFLDLQLGQAMGRFFNELEDWLSAFARFNDSNPSPAIGQSALASGMSEEAARAVYRSPNLFQMEKTTAPACWIRCRNYPAQWRSLMKGMADDQRIRDHLAVKCQY